MRKNKEKIISPAIRKEAKTTFNVYATFSRFIQLYSLQIYARYIYVAYLLCIVTLYSVKNAIVKCFNSNCK